MLPLKDLDVDLTLSTDSAERLGQCWVMSTWNYLSLWCCNTAISA